MRRNGRTIKKMATDTFTHNSQHTKTTKVLSKMHISPNKLAIPNVLPPAGVHFAPEYMAFFVTVSCFFFSRYFGKMYNFLYGQLKNLYKCLF